MNSTLKTQLHPARAAALAELHARPAPAIGSRAQVSRLIFLGGEEAQQGGASAIAMMCERAGATLPPLGARHHSLVFGKRELRWERHTEFVSYTIISGADARSAQVWSELTDDPRIEELHTSLLALMTIGVAPEVREAATDDEAASAACGSHIAGARARVTTSYKADAHGFVHFELRHEHLAAAELGSLCQMLLEIESYRMLALIALPVARQAGAFVQEAERQLAELTRRIEASGGAETSEALFAEASALAARIEARIAATTYRFSAAAAYGSIVEDRLGDLDEAPLDGLPPLGVFLRARLTPALRTCSSMNLALANLAERCSRAADLIRTRIDLQVSQQNNKLLGALNERTRLQMRLQQTVEGLSVIAISYYALGLIGYLAKGAKDAGMLKFEPTLAIAISAPFVLAIVGWMIVRIRRRHAHKE